MQNLLTYSAVVLFFLQQVTLSDGSISLGLSLFGAIGATLYANFDKLVGCSFSECCSTKTGSGNWIKPNITALQNAFASKLHGQHLVKDVVIKAVMAHYSNDQPFKALVLSFHGWTGGGKNFAARIIVESIYKAGMNSKFVHLFVSTIHFPHEDQVDIYKLQIQDWIRGNVSLCQHSLFIFDEIDKMPVGMIDAIKPFIDYHHSIFGVDFRKSVFLFLSNTGSREIIKKMLDMWRNGQERSSITQNDMEDLIQKGAFNELGGLHNSELIQHSLVDFFVPFLPLERKHIELCAKDELKRRGVNPSKEVIQQVVDAMLFFPPENKLYSTTGCKKVASKVGFILTEQMYDDIFS